MQEPVFSRESGFSVVGMEIRTTNAAEADPATARIGTLWGQVHGSPSMRRVAERATNDKLFAVYHDYESDENGAYSQLVGYRVPGLDVCPVELIGLALSDGYYLVFTAEGEMPAALIETWGEVWEYFKQPGTLKRAFSHDYEIHESLTRVQVYIAVQPPA